MRELESYRGRRDVAIKKAAIEIKNTPTGLVFLTISSTRACDGKVVVKAMLYRRYSEVRLELLWRGRETANSRREDLCDTNTKGGMR